jgi:hypothetical protein
MSGVALGTAVVGAYGASQSGGGGGGGGGMGRKSINRATVQAYKDFDPYISGGQSAQQQLMAQMGLGDGKTQAYDITQMPGYQGALKQGLGAVNQGAAGSGMLMSGERMKGLQTAGQNIYGDYYSNYMNRLQGMSNQGMNAVGSVQNIRQGNQAMMNQNSQLQQQAGGAQGRDIMGLAGSLGGMFAGNKGGGGGGEFNFGSLMGGGSGGMDFSSFSSPSSEFNFSGWGGV